MVLAWAAFLGRGEIINLQLCDLTWVMHQLEVFIRKAKADQLGLTAVTELEYASAGSDKCLLTFFETYLKQCLGGCPFMGNALRETISLMRVQLADGYFQG